MNDPGNETTNDLSEGEILRVEVYEEFPEIHKQTVIREMVQVRKVRHQEAIAENQADPSPDASSNRSI